MRGRLRLYRGVSEPQRRPADPDSDQDHQRTAFQDKHHAGDGRERCLFVPLSKVRSDRPVPMRQLRQRPAHQPLHQRTQRGVHQQPTRESALLHELVIPYPLYLC